MEWAEMQRVTECVLGRNCTAHQLQVARVNKDTSSKNFFTRSQREAASSCSRSRSNLQLQYPHCSTRTCLSSVVIVHNLEPTAQYEGGRARSVTAVSGRLSINGDGAAKSHRLVEMAQVLQATCCRLSRLFASYILAFRVYDCRCKHGRYVVRTQEARNSKVAPAGPGDSSRRDRTPQKAVRNNCPHSYTIGLHESELP